MAAIKSILDTDLYKFTSSYSYMKLFPDAEGTFKFCDRDNTVYNTNFLDMLRLELSNLECLKLTLGELDFVNREIRFIPQCYWEWLKSFQFNPNKIRVYLDGGGQGHLHISITDKLYRATLYETPILAIVSEVRNNWLGHKADADIAVNRTLEKIRISNENQIKFSEFGTRRRFNYHIQDTVCKTLKEYATYCTGTSNVHLAMKHGMKVIGTHPHEWFMFHGAVFGYKMANYMALENWVNTFDGDLGIALSDTYTTDVFFKNFSKKHAKLFDGIRQDSGDEFEFVDKAIARYNELGINPQTKTIIFSNALDFEKAKDINSYCKDKINAAFGIGTNLTNDCGHRPANIVMKLSQCRMNTRQHWQPCVKLSDDIGKHMGLSKEVEICKHECGL